MRCIIRIPLVLIFCFFLSLIFISACEERPRQIETQFENSSSLDSSGSSSKKIHVEILIGTHGDPGKLYPSELEAKIEGCITSNTSWTP
mgnify:CR=1 FL=1